ncbi:MAG: phospholipase D family protein [Verrucomicrobiae bacterium]
MKCTTLIQTPVSAATETVQGFLKKFTKEREYDVIKVAMAYVTVAGVRTLLEGFRDGQICESKWLIGLDDCISQPGAIELLKNLGHAQLKVASLQKKALRFHPKLCYFGDSVNREAGFFMIGSANLTKTGLRGNAEGVAFFHTENQADYSQAMGLWKTTWKLGHEPSNTEIADYKGRYDALRRFRMKHEAARPKERRKPKRALVLDTDNAELDPSLASSCWIECGYITAMGRELEFKAEQGLFFGLDPTGGNARDMRFILSNGQVTVLRMKYQGNHMWRLQLNNSVPEVARGLRLRLHDGSLARSEYVAVFEEQTKEIFIKCAL